MLEAEHELLAAARERIPFLFRELLGLRVRLLNQEHDSPSLGRVDFEFELSEPEGRKWAIAVDVKSNFQDLEMQPAFRRHLRKLQHEHSSRVPLLVLPRVTKRTRNYLRAEGVNHADFGGAIYIRASGLYVDLEAQKAFARWSRGPNQSSAHSKRNPFADKASLVLRTLFEDPHKPWRVTEISETASLTKGWVSQVASELGRRGYVKESAQGIRLAHPDQVLRDWTAFYSWQRNQVESYAVPFNYHEVLEQLRSKKEPMGSSQWALTLHGGMDQVAPHVKQEQIYLYLAAESYHVTRHQLATKLFLEPVSSGGNINLVRPYYRQSVFYGSRVEKGLPIVSDLQLFLDLVHFPLRGPEAAEMILRRRLGRKLDVSPAFVETL